MASDKKSSDAQRRRVPVGRARSQKHQFADHLYSSDHLLAATYTTNHSKKYPRQSVSSLTWTYLIARLFTDCRGLLLPSMSGTSIADTSTRDGLAFSRKATHFALSPEQLGTLYSTVLLVLRQPSNRSFRIWRGRRVWSIVLSSARRNTPAYDSDT